MPARLLIVDDDANFNDLLANIFQRAGYRVVTAGDAAQGLRLLSTSWFDLVVTDQRMPEVSGMEFIRRARAAGHRPPFIVVSGFLDHQAVQSLMQEGVEGVFLKPLNILALLKRAAELAPVQSPGAREPSTSPAAGLRERFQGHGYVGQSRLSRQFLARLAELRGGRKSLILIGEDGVDFAGVARDLCGVQESADDWLLVVAPEDVTEEALQTRLGEASERGARQITLVALRAADLRVDQFRWLQERARGSPLVGEPELRLLYCLPRTPDELLESGQLTEETYLALGVEELRLPPLREVSEDIPALAEQILRRLSEGRISLEPSAADFLRRQPWPGNHAELEKVLEAALPGARGGSLGLSALGMEAERAESPEASPPVSPNADSRPGVREDLREGFTQLALATLLLTRQDPRSSALLLGVSPDLVEPHLERARDLAEIAVLPSPVP